MKSSIKGIEVISICDGYFNNEVAVRTWKTVFTKWKFGKGTVVDDYELEYGQSHLAVPFSRLTVCTLKIGKEYA